MCLGEIFTFVAVRVPMVKLANQSLFVQGDADRKSAHLSAASITEVETMRAALLVRTFEARGRVYAWWIFHFLRPCEDPW